MGRPVEVIPSRRRRSTGDSTGLDYSSCRRIDEDIISRIRSLLVSRNGHYPPRTPFSSAEHFHRYSEGSDTVDIVASFDFSTAKSVARLARLSSGRLSLPWPKTILRNQSQSSMDVQVSQRPTEPILQTFKRSSLRSTSSTNDLTDDARIHATDLTCCPPCAPEEQKKRLPPPRSIFRDEKQQGTDIRSCIEINPGSPPDDTLIHETELLYSPPCDPPGVKSSKHTEKKKTSSIIEQVANECKAEPSDLACFLAGCPPGPGECKEHHRQQLRSHLSSKDKERLWDDFKATEHDIGDEISEFGLALKGITVRSPFVVVGINDKFESSCDKPHIRDDKWSSAIKRPADLAERPQPDGARSTPAHSLRSSDTVDAFPHAVQSQEVASKDISSQCLTTKVFTNFNLPGPKPWEASQSQQKEHVAKRSQMSPSKEQGTNKPQQSYSKGDIPNKPQQEPRVETDIHKTQTPPSDDGLSSKQPTAPMGAKPQSPSLLSGASKASTYHHTLLKPSVSEGQPIDTGLPVPPVLTPITGVPEKPMDNEVQQGVAKKPRLSALSNSTESEALPSPVISHLITLQKAKDLVDSVKGRINDSKDQRNAKSRKKGESSNDQQSRTTASNALSKSLGRAKMPDRPEEPIPDSFYSTPAVDSLNAVYWGFVPAVKEVVENAVQVAVHNAVHEVVVRPETEQDEASEAYRRLVADSLAQVAKNADEYLRRSSLGNEAPSSLRASEVDIGLKGVDLDTGMKTLDVTSKHQENSDKRGDHRLENSTKIFGSTVQKSMPYDFALRPRPPSPDKRDTVPLRSRDEQLPDNQKHGWRIPSPFKKGSPEYTAIPTRQSSRNRVLSPKSKTINSRIRLSPKGPQPRTRSYEKLAATASRDIRPESSLCSLKSFGSASKTPKIFRGLSHNRSSTSERPSQENLGRKNTVHRLRDLLSNNEPYGPRLTALPPRTRRDQNSSTGRLRSQTAPAKPVAELFLGATPNPANQNAGNLTRETFNSREEKKAIMTETLTKTINDLENLLSEALLIARQAADREDTRYIPRLLSDATAILKDGGNVLVGRGPRRRPRMNSAAYRSTDDISSIASIHESLRSFSGSSASDRSEDVELYHHTPSDMFRKNEIPNILKGSTTVSAKIEQTSHQAGWPPTGRVPTPYPPGSLSPASGTPATPVGEGNSGVDKAGKLKSVGIKAKLVETVLSGKNATGSITFAPAQGENAGSDYASVDIQFKNIDPFVREPSVDNESGSTRISPGDLSLPTGCRRIQDPTMDQNSGQGSSKFTDEHTGPHDFCGPHPMPSVTPGGASPSKQVTEPQTVIDAEAIKSKMQAGCVPTKREARQYIQVFHHPPIQPRTSSLALRKQAEQAHEEGGVPTSPQDTGHNKIEPCCRQETRGTTSAHDLPRPGLSQDRSRYTHSLDGSYQPGSEEIHWDTGYGVRHHGDGDNKGPGGHEAVELRDNPDPNLPEVSRNRISGRRTHHLFNLKGKNHVSLREHKGFSLARSHKRQSIARDWSPGRKRFVATVACISTALVGILVGIYAGEVPAIQYLIVDLHHYTILGNVFFFIGLSIPTFFFWPLPLLHGRKPYILGSMSIAMPLLFPQALSVGEFRSPYISTWRVALLLSRAVMGFCLGFANMNFKSVLTDLFGASLQSANPHQEVVDEYDVRRHGGGMGVWLGIWTWCCIGSIGIGFLIGAVIINHLNPAWGFYASICIIAGVLLLNVLCPEVRRSAFRRSVAEVVNGEQVSRRLARGEVKMHLVQTGPKWWGEEFHYGMILSANMLRQPGFLVMAFYVAWIYGQIVLIIVVSDNAVN
jgi:MFS family permease